jgi:ABC-type sugar transport system ATPase subunit
VGWCGRCIATHPAPTPPPPPPRAGVDGLTTEQRKRLTIGVELVTNPSVLFLDEPSSGAGRRAC